MPNHSWLQRCRQAPDGRVPYPEKRPGSSKRVSEKTLKVIKRQLQSDATLSAREVKENNPCLLGTVSTRTVSRYIHDSLALPSRRAACKPLLTARHKANRVKFAKKYIEWPLEKIRSILWSDESVFTVTGTPRARVRRPVGADRHDPRYTVKTVEHPASVMVWGSFTYHGVGVLVFLEPGVSMNANRYLELLYDHLELCFEKCQAAVFQQDGAPCHTARPVKQWLSDCAVDYIEDWPGNSLDLNPIEILWRIVKSKLREKDTSSVPKLKDAILEVWNNLDTDMLHNIVDSVPRRLREVIKRKGNVTKY